MGEAAENFDSDSPEQSQKLLRDKLRTIIGRLGQEADDRVAKRKTIEERWLDDLRQYHGVYTTKMLEKFEAQQKSRVFINQTRPKTNAMEARLSDMLFPTDDRNWGIQPTPVPELTVESQERARAAAEASLAAAENEEDQQLQAAADEAELASREVQQVLEQARKRARAMTEEIDDHLRESKYGSQCRRVIRDACKIGTGVIKGPISGGRSRQVWELVDAPVEHDGDPRNKPAPRKEFQLRAKEDPRPVFWRTDPWHFFPDMDASETDDSEGFFERHLMNRKALRRLARQPGFDSEAIRRTLLHKSPATVPSFLSELRSITASNTEMVKDSYIVWEYHGPLAQEDLKTLAEALGDVDLLGDLEEADVDPLTETEVVVWFCEEEAFKFGIHHLDSEEPIYSVFNLEKDESSLFGFGVPYLMRDSQKALAAGWRMMLDNAGLSSGPQIVIDEEVIEPVDGVYQLAPRKIWRRNIGIQRDRKPFETFNIESHQADLENIIRMAMEFIDVETAMPMIAQGEQGASVTKTFQGMAILMNSVNVVFRRIVKNFDDDLTTPNIRRMYHWLMQFSDKEAIKGDYQVDARGTSVLLVKEMQSQNLMLFLTNFVEHPSLGKFIKEQGLPALRRLVQTLMLPADEIIKSDTEIRDDEAKAARQPPPPDPEMEKIAAQLNLEKMRGKNATDLEYLRRETALIELAQSSNMKLEELRQKLADSREERASKERILAAEVAVQQQQPNKPGGGGYV